MDDEEINSLLLIGYHAPQYHLKCNLLLRKNSSPFCNRGYWRFPSAVKSSLSLKPLEGLYNARLESLVFTN